MTSTSESPSLPSTTSRKRTIKSKLDESVLKKARAAIGLPVESHEDVEEKVEQSLKWRKPRHNTEEGQLYVKNKERRKQLEKQEVSSKPVAKIPSKIDTKTGKKKRKSKKKKGKSNTTTPTESVKDPESEKRHGMEAISYIQLWSTNRDHWKFEKRKQTWLLKNCLNAALIDDTRFELVLEYMASMKGAARQATLTEMQSIVKKHETESGSSATSSAVISEGMYERARQIIQMLTDD